MCFIIPNFLISPSLSLLPFSSNSFFFSFHSFSLHLVSSAVFLVSCAQCWGHKDKLIIYMEFSFWSRRLQSPKANVHHVVIFLKSFTEGKIKIKLNFIRGAVSVFVTVKIITQYNKLKQQTFFMILWISWCFLLDWLGQSQMVWDDFMFVLEASAETAAVTGMNRTLLMVSGPGLSCFSWQWMGY